MAETLATKTAAIKYRAFLSYSHRDAAWGKWLHAALEGYGIDRDLVGRQTPAGPVPKTLRPIFRDREDFSAGHSLSEQTLAALEASRFLIVICSPNAAQSRYVDEEIRRFKAMGRGEHVIPLIVDGEPGDPARECFPPALRFKLGPDGALTNEREEPIAADARPQGDGKDIARLKLVAGLLAVGLDEIVRRAERARKRRNRFWAALAGVLLLLAVAASGSAAYAWQQLRTNEAFLNATLRRATEIVDAAVAQAEKYNVPRNATLQLLGKAEGLFDDMAQFGRPTLELRYRKAWMLIQFARNYAILGDANKQRERAIEALALLSGLAAERPEVAGYQRDWAVAHVEVGDVLVAQGYLAQALKSFRAALTIRERMARDDPTNAGLQFNLGISHERVGDVLKVQGDLVAALQAYETRRAIIETLAKLEPGNANWQRDLSVAGIKIGDTLVAQGNLAQALKSFRDSLAIIERLARSDPGNAGWQHDLSVSDERVGDVLVALGNLADALKSFREGLAVRERLAKSDPSNATWQRDLSVSYERVGDVLSAQGNAGDALASFRDDLAVRQRLAKADPSNAGWQRDLSWAYLKVGEALAAQRNLADALTSFRDGFVIRERLAKLDPTNAGSQRDLAWAHTKVGEVLGAQGDLAQALASFRDGLAIFAQLARSDPTNATSQRDLSASHARIGDVLVAQGDLAQALISYREGLAVTAQLAAKDDSNVQWRTDRQSIIIRIGNLAYRFVLVRDFASALAAADQAISLAPEKIWIYGNRAHALMLLGRVDEARAVYLRYRGEQKVQGEASWEAVTREDFAELRKAGLAHPLMDEIEKLFVE